MSIYLKVMGLLYALVVLAGSLLVLLLHFIFGAPLDLSFLILLLAAVPLSLVIFRVMMNRERSNPDSILHAEFMSELVTNGYTQKAFELAEQAFEKKRTGQKMNFVYFKDFAIYVADYYNLMQENEKALTYLDLVDKSEVLTNSTRIMDGGLTILTYYEVLMEAFRGTKAKTNAKLAFMEVRPYLDKKYPQDVLNIMADMIGYHYSMLMEDFEQAKQYVDRMMSYTSELAQSNMGRYLALADYCKQAGYEAQARDAMKLAHERMSPDQPVLEEIYGQWMERLGFE